MQYIYVTCIFIGSTIQAMELATNNKNIKNEVAQAARQEAFKGNYMQALEGLQKEEAISRLIEIVTETQAKDPLLHAPKVPLLLQALKAIDSEKLYDKVLTALNEDWNRTSIPIREMLFNGIVVWALQHNRVAILQEAAVKILETNWQLYNHGRGCREYFAHAIRVIRVLASLDNQRACNWISLFERYSFNTQDMGENQFDLLLLMREVTPSKFEELANKLKAQYLPKFLKGLLKYSNYKKTFKNSCLDISIIINIGLDRLLQEEATNTNKFFEVFVNLAQEYHTQFEPRIVQALPSLLHSHPLCYESVIVLIDSQAKNIRKAAYNALVGYLIKPRAASSFLYQCILEEFFKLDIDRIATDYSMTAIDLYKNFYLALKAEDNEETLQRLLIYLLANQATNILARKLIIDRLKIFDGSTIHSLMQCDNAQFVTEAFRETKMLTLKEITRIIAIAEKTGFISFIDKKYLNKLHSNQLFNAEIPLEDRVVLLHSMLTEVYECSTNLPSYKQKLEDFSVSLNFLEQGIFKRYAQTVMRAMDPDALIHENFAAKRQLYAIAKKEPRLPAEPTIITKTTGILFNATKVQCREQPAFLKSLEQKFEDPNITGNGLMFGYVYVGDHHNCLFCLHACEEETGQAVWHAPIKFKEKTPYALWQDKAYIAHDNANGANCISVLESKTGNYQATLTLPNESTIYLIKITDKGKMFVAQGDDKDDSHYLTCIDLNTNDIYYSTPITYTTDCYIIGEMLGLYSSTYPDNTLELYNAQSQKPKQLKLSNTSFYFPYLAFKNNFMLYQSEEKTDKNTRHYKLICYNLCNDSILWGLELPESLEQDPILSSDGTMIYAMTKHAVLAIQMNLQSEGEKRILWQTPINHLRFEIKLSSDDKTLYGLDIDYGNLFTFDCQSGAKMEVGVFEEARSMRLLKVLKDKVYLQGVFY